MKLSSLKGQIAVAALTLAAGAALAETPSWCGPNKASLALLDGYGGNSWRLVTTASGIQPSSSHRPA